MDQKDYVVVEAFVEKQMDLIAAKASSLGYVFHRFHDKMVSEPVVSEGISFNVFSEKFGHNTFCLIKLVQRGPNPSKVFFDLVKCDFNKSSPVNSAMRVQKKSLFDGEAVRTEMIIEAVGNIDRMFF